MKLQFDILELKLFHPWKLSRTNATLSSGVVIVKLTDSSGVCGFGEAAPASRYGETVESVVAFLGEVDANRISFETPEESMTYIEANSSADFAAKCALDVALTDGAAKLNKQVASEFLGLPFGEKKHVTSFTLGIGSAEVMREKALAASHFPILKIKLGTSEDRKILQAVREVAPDKTIRVDANEGWETKEHALEMTELLAADGRVQFVEQPLSATTSVADWKWLKAHSPLPIIADESYHTARDADQVAECFHGVNVKLVKAGGITPAARALAAARRLGLKTMLGCMIETSILISAAAHLAELCDYLDLDGNLLITNDPYTGVTAKNGLLSFASAKEPFGLRASPRILPNPFQKPNFASSDSSAI